jgi:hypothetical protein
MGSSFNENDPQMISPIVNTPTISLLEIDQWIILFNMKITFNETKGYNYPLEFH